MTITIKNVTHRYDQLTALDHISYTFPPESTTIIIGPSGCGKSTLLRVILGLIIPTEGTVHINGIPLNPTTVRKLRRLIGFVVQEGGLFPHLNARDNILFLPRYLHQDPRWMKERLEFLCDLTRFPTSALDRYPLELSGGQRQRVSLMRALMMDPPILLLDEPLGALDPLTRHALQSELKGIFEQLRKTVIMVTHDMAEAAYLGTTLVLMNRGQIVQVGPYEELKSSPATPFVRQFLEAQRQLATL